MKKVLNYLKVIVIIILVAAAIGGTVYFFFTHFRTQPNAFEDVRGYLYGGDKSYLNSAIKDVHSAATAEDNDKKNPNLQLLIVTNEKLDEFTETLTSYLIVANNYNINNNEIAAQLNNVKAAQSGADVVIKEFLQKNKGASFDPALGANEVFKSFSKYLIAYSNLVSYLNGEIAKLNVNRDADIKFYIIDLYTNILNVTFTDDNIDGTGEFTQIKDRTNLDAIQGADGSKLNLQNSFIKSNETFTSYINEFIKNYKNCNKLDLAKTFNSVLTSVENNELEAYSSEQYSERLAVCFKKIMGE